jgi:hypothetical protein
MRINFERQGMAEMGDWPRRSFRPYFVFPPLTPRSASPKLVQTRGRQVNPAPTYRVRKPNAIVVNLTGTSVGRARAAYPLRGYSFLCAMHKNLSHRHLADWKACGTCQP